MSAASLIGRDGKKGAGRERGYGGRGERERDRKGKQDGQAEAM